MYQYYAAGVRKTAAEGLAVQKAGWKNLRIRKMGGWYGMFAGIICTVCFVCLSGCGSSDELYINIFDMRTQTRLAAKAGITVEQALDEAEIAIGHNDRVSPALDAELFEDGTDIRIERCAKATVIEDGQACTVELTGAKVKDAVRETAAALGKHDVVSHDLDAFLTDGMEIEITHRYAVGVSVDGKQETYITQENTVAGLLEELGIELGKKDKITPGISQRLQDGMQVVVYRVSVRKVSEFEPIPFETKTEYSNSMEQGTSMVKQQGEDGGKELIYRVRYVDGEEDRRTFIKEKVKKEPVDQIIVKGTAVKKKTVPAAPSAQDSASAPAGRRIVSRQPVYDCDGSGHGYYVITWSDGAVEYQDF